jgi:hypothetical protein
MSFMSLLEVEEPPREWISKYWQWIYSFHQGKSPLESGSISCQSNGVDNFLCFPCTGGGEDCNRSVTLTGENAKKDILIPVFTAAYNGAELGKTLSQHQLLKKAKNDVRDPISLELTLDNVPLKFRYVESLPFLVKVPINQDFSKYDESQYVTLSAGYWCRLRPLSPGTHTVKFGGTGRRIRRNSFHTKVQYLIRVK